MAHVPTRLTMATANQKVIKSDYLFCQTGSSDKVYEIELVQSVFGGLYSVNVCWGRRGSKLNDSTKLENSNWITANDQYDKLVDEKVNKKGYQRRGIGNSAARLHPRLPPNSTTYEGGVVKRPRAKKDKVILNPTGSTRKLILD